MSDITDELINAAKRADYYRTGESGLIYEAAKRLTQADVDTAHAIALEREAIAAWLAGHTAADRVYANSIGQSVIAVIFDGTPQDLIEAIRDGAHNDTEETK